MTETSSWPVVLAATSGIVASAFSAGGAGLLSSLAVPGLLSAPVSSLHLAKQWEGMYVRGKVQGPRNGLVALLGFAYLAYARRAEGRDWAVIAAAAGLSIAIVPFTLLVMMPTNDALLGVASGTAAKGLSDQAVRDLVGKWGTLNTVRSLFPLAASVLACWTLLASA